MVLNTESKKMKRSNCLLSIEINNSGSKKQRINSCAPENFHVLSPHRKRKTRDCQEQNQCKQTFEFWKRFKSDVTEACSPKHSRSSENKVRKLSRTPLVTYTIVTKVLPPPCHTFTLAIIHSNVLSIKFPVVFD